MIYVWIALITAILAGLLHLVWIARHYQSCSVTIIASIFTFFAAVTILSFYAEAKGTRELFATTTLVLYFLGALPRMRKDRVDFIRRK